MYSTLGYASIQFGVNLNKIKGFNSLANQQSFWAAPERALYQEAMSDKIENFRKEYPDLVDRRFALTTFSNNGLQTWDQTKSNFEHPKGFIFDSGPTLPTELESFVIPGRIFSANN